MVRSVSLCLTAMAGVAAGAFAAQPSSTPSFANQLAAMPNTAVRYYDVSGRDVTEINRSMARQRPKSRDGKPIPATLDWAVKADFQRTVNDGVCKVSGATATYTATAELPRLVDGHLVDKPVRNRWQTYVDQLEEGSLATVAFVHQNLRVIEKAMLASSCDQAKAAGAAAIERMRARTELLDADREKRLRHQNATLSEFRSTGFRVQKKICKDIRSTESRVRTFRICMPQREWDRMQDDGEAFTREIQDQSISAKYF